MTHNVPQKAGREPWLAYSGRCAASTNTGVLGGQPKDHATIDGATTLCGMREISQNRDVMFDPDGAYSCKHCARKTLALFGEVRGDAGEAPSKGGGPSLAERNRIHPASASGAGALDETQNSATADSAPSPAPAFRDTSGVGGRSDQETP